MPQLGHYPTMDGDYKLCAGCRKWKHKRTFVKCNRVSSGIGSYCRKCHNANGRRSFYGHNIELDREIDECEICGGNEHLRIDHGVEGIRGTLCHKCNIGLGMFDHDVELLQGAINYLVERGTVCRIPL